MKHHTGPRQLHKMTPRKAETITTPGRHGDGGGLYLSVGKGGARSWVFLYRGRELGLGPAKGPGKDGLGLKQARDRASDARQTLMQGQDPLALKRAGQVGSQTFGDFGDSYLESITGGFKMGANSKTAYEWKRALEVHAKALRPINIDAVTTDDVLNVLRPIWRTIPKTATEVRGKIEKVLDAAKAVNMRRGDNPARWKGHLDVLLDNGNHKKEHHAAVKIDDMPGIVKALRATPSAANLALELVILTATRSSEARGIQLSEVDFDAMTWTVPAERMKRPIAHVVPLSERAAEIIRSSAPFNLSEKALLRSMNLVAPGATVHGCRSTFRDWAGNRTDFPREIAEMALAHAVGDAAEQAYRRETALEKRRALMNQWVGFVEGSPATNNVIPMRG
jgi:integrase